jgi:hypothetical protein
MSEAGGAIDEPGNRLRLNRLRSAVGKLEKEVSRVTDDDRVVSAAHAVSSVVVILLLALVPYLLWRILLDSR